MISSVALATAGLIVGLILLVKGADYFISSAEKIGRALHFSPFVIGVLLVGIGTSLPEFASAIAALLAGNTDIIPANAIGSNIANILLVVGVLAVVGRRIIIKQDLLASELSLFAVSTVLFVSAAFDGVITVIESVLLAAAFVIYLLYTIFGNHEEMPETAKYRAQQKRGPIKLRTIGVFFLGLAGVIVGARILIDSTIYISEMVGIATGVIALTLIALGTSLPELFVSLSAARKGHAEVAIGNIFGSNAFNILFAVGIPGLMTTLTLDEKTLTIGLPILVVASFIFVISGIARRIYRWEGLMFLIYYVFFTIKILGL